MNLERILGNIQIANPLIEPKWKISVDILVLASFENKKLLNGISGTNNYVFSTFSIILCQYNIHRFSRTNNYLCCVFIIIGRHKNYSLSSKEP